jgi:hypothetical protein
MLTITGVGNSITEAMAGGTSYALTYRHIGGPQVPPLPTLSREGRGIEIPSLDGMGKGQGDKTMKSQVHLS